jgi:hypothetical protein
MSNSLCVKTSIPKLRRSSSRVNISISWGIDVRSAGIGGRGDRRGAEPGADIGAGVVGVEGDIGIVSGLPGIANRRWGRGVDPVGAASDDGVASDVLSWKAPVVSAEWAVRLDDVPKVAGNIAIVANLVARGASQVVAEATHAAVELLEDNSLSLDFADLLCDDPLSHLLEDNKTLLDDLNLLGVADKLVLVDDGLAKVLGAIKVTRAIEVVEAIERRESTPVVERVWVSATRHVKSVLGDGLRDHTGGHGSNQKQRSEDLGEHDGGLNNVKLGLGAQRVKEGAKEATWPKSERNRRRKNELKKVKQLTRPFYRKDGNAKWKL